MLFVAKASKISMPVVPWPEMTLRKPGAVPPMRLRGVCTNTPEPAEASVLLPDPSRPTKQPSTTLLPRGPGAVPNCICRIDKPRTTLLEVSMTSLSTTTIFKTASSPTVRVLALEPDWVYPSMVIGSVTVGGGVAGVIVNGPMPLMLKLITSGTLTVPLAVISACRNEPAPVSLVLVTGMVAHQADWPVMAKKSATQAANKAFRRGMAMVSERPEAQ